ncbi:hypothetical protein TrVFT333_005257 [Trichoderma virens FT-333]|nr:hypothetical protein TrVFT333_005257 [Trichoderma virens FT-333]
MASNKVIMASPRFICRSCSRQARSSASYRRSYATASSQDIYDVVCIGGGPAGLSLLTALRANPTTSRLRVALVEAQDLSKTASLSTADPILQPMQLPHTYNSPVSKHYRGVWDGVTDARIEFDYQLGSSATQGNVIAYMAENINITSGLLKRIKELGGVDVFDSSRVEKITFGEETEDLDLTEWPVVHLQGGKSLAARLLVGADGANSPVRSFARIESRGWDYDRHGVVATLELEGDGWGGEYRKTAYQRFLPTGPVAMLPLPGNFATLVWSTTPANAALLKRLSTKDFIALVNSAFRLSPVDLAYMHTQATGQEDELAWRLQHTNFDAEAIPQLVVGVQEGSVASFPLKFRHADSYISERIALVGDAAHSVHPLAGQGLNQGQGDIQSLVKTIEYAVAHGQDLGTQMALESYNSERYAANHVLMGVCDKLHKLYSVGSGPLIPLRSLGLKAANALGPLKDFFMDQASGRGLRV